MGITDGEMETMTMHAKILKLGSLFLAAAVASLGSAAHADNINTSGTVCNNFNAGEAQDVDYVGTGVRIANAAARTVVCAIPRSPLAAGAIPEFFVDGTNSGANSTSCTLFTYSFTGAITQSFFFTRTGTYDQLVTFAANGVGTFDYADVVCTLPGGFGGILFGITSVQ
jgi:hypothetical protein